MRLDLYFRVLWRFKFVVALGMVAALALTFLSVARFDLSTHKVTYRSSEQWTSYARIFVTERGFPYGAVDANGGDPARFAANAILYSQLATSDAVTRLAFAGTKPPGTIQAAPVLASADSSDALPIVSIAATAASADTAKELARREMEGLIRYVGVEQERAAIPVGNRVVLQVILQPEHAELTKGRSKTLPIVVFLCAMLAVVGLAFVFENLRPLPAFEEQLPVALPPRSNVA
jgi:hypothetical protein